MSHYHYTHLEQDLFLLPEKAIYWSQHKMMIISDPHFGKIQHFRKAGLAVPKAASYKNWQRLFQLLARPDLEQVLFLGDLFHSDWNQEWKDFAYLLSQFPELRYHLVLGNHDSLDENWYSDSRINIHKELLLGPYHFTHEPEETNEYNICGHIHPAVRLRGSGRQGLRLPCFYFGKQQAILPAFGIFTGTHKIKSSKEDDIFVIAENQIIKV